MTRVTDLASHNLTLASMRRNQESAVAEQIRISSGKQAQRYQGIARDSARLLNLEAEHARTGQFMENNRIVGIRLQKIETNVAAVFDIASQFRALLVNGLNGQNMQEIAIAQEAASRLDQVAGLLNEREDGRHLFAGSRTDTAPVDLSALPAGGAFAESAAAYYYRGDDRPPTVRADEGLDVTYGVTAAEPGFEALIQALHMAGTADLSDPDAARRILESALALVNRAIDETPAIRSRVGAAARLLETVNAKHDQFQLYAEQAVGEIENADAATAITKLADYQNTLDASYAALARIRSTSLLDYLR